MQTTLCLVPKKEETRRGYKSPRKKKEMGMMTVELTDEPIP